ncbi:MAG: beta-galactosidase [Mangrovibacterium sp.]
MKTLNLILFLACLFLSAQSQQQYQIDISNDQYNLSSGHLHLGNHISPSGETLSCTNFYFTRNGRPWYPVMGEVHYPRVPRERWEEAILKMKSAGINVIASYIFWIFHEEEKGVFTWEGNRDLREFGKLCAKHHLYFFPRIGPWCHGEVRNGGFPDWVAKLKKTRQNDPAYLSYVTRLFEEISAQLAGMYFKDGGPVIGIQIENEYGFKHSAGLEHLLTLKKIAVDAGIDVPYYTATGWPDSDQQQTELIPVWGAYPAAPWEQHTRKLPPLDNFLMNPLGNDPRIGKDLLGHYESDKINLEVYQYPFATAEMGGGNQVAYHRRPLFNANDVADLAYVKAGSGANLMGYYMFHGGINPIGKFSTLQESKQTGYANYLPIINYDFQSPIGSMENLRPSFSEFKLFHSFLNEFGELLAPLPVFFPARRVQNPGSSDTVRVAVRAKDNSGFIFLSNYQRHVDMKQVKGFRLMLKNGIETMKIPEKPVCFPANSMMVWPFNFDMEGSKLVYATAQLVSKVETAGKTCYVFWSGEGAEFVFEKAGIDDLKASEAYSSVQQKEGKYYLTVKDPGLDCLVQVRQSSGKSFEILVLNKQQALRSWKFNSRGHDHFIVTDADLMTGENTLIFQKTNNPQTRFSVFPDLEFTVPEGWNVTKSGKHGQFSEYKLQTQPIMLKAEYQELKPEIPDYLIYDQAALNKVKQSSSVPYEETDKIWNGNGEDQTFFRKNFTVGNTAGVQAYFIFTPDDEAKVYCNGTLLDIFNADSHVALLNLTRYIHPGNNVIGLKLKNQNGPGGLLAKLFVLENNGIKILPGDPAWKVNTIENSGWEKPGFDDSQWALAVPVALPRTPVLWENPQSGPLYGVSPKLFPGTKLFQLSIPGVKNKSVRDVLLKLDYRADMLALYKNGILAYDEFYYGDDNLVISLNSLGLTGNDEVTVQLFPVKSYYDLFVEDEVRQRYMEGISPKIEHIGTEPLYEVQLQLK